MTAQAGLHRPLVALAVMLALGVGVAGCGAPAASPGKPGAGQPPPAPIPAPARPGPGLPPRPAVLPVDNVDPCRLLTDAQARQLGVNPGEPHMNNDEMPGPDCRWNNFPNSPDKRWLAQPLPTRGAEYALGSTTGAQVVQVGAFSAVQTTSPFAERRWSCILLVDVAPGQSLLVQYLNGGGDDPTMTHERACQNAATGAGLMIHNLRTLAR